MCLDRPRKRYRWRPLEAIAIKSLKKDDLLSIQGVGDKTLRVLFDEFGSLTKISKASYDELVIVVKPSIAEKVYEFFNRRY